MFKSMIRSGLSILLVGVGMAPLLLAQSPGGSYPDWRRHRDRVLDEASVVRYYTFERATGTGALSEHPWKGQADLERRPSEQDAGSPLANRAGASGALTLRTAGGETKDLIWVEGRWPEKQAVRLDRDYLAAEPFIVMNSSFTVVTWYRTHGMGSIAGDSVATGATLLSVGSGYWDGWRVTLRYPEQVLGFEIGRPRPSSSIGIRGGRAADHTWHHLAATWDGRQMRLYLDGCTVARGDYSGPYTLPPQGAAFRIGFAGAGWGSAVLDVDEVIVYRRALTPIEVLRQAHFYAPLDEPAADRFAAAERLIEAGDLAAAANEYRALAGREELHVDYRAVARLRLARLFKEQGDRPGALAEWAAVAEMTGVAESHTRAALGALLESISLRSAPPAPAVLEKLLAISELAPRDRAVIRFQLARRWRDDGDFAAARLHYLGALTSAELSPREKLDAQLEMAHVCFAAGDYATARAEYAKVLANAAAPGHYKSQAQLQIAASYARENELSAARREYARLATLPDVPEHHRWEAQACQRELARREAGLPPRDPAASHTVLPPSPRATVQLYVAPDGSDANPGTRQRPLASLEKARDTIRELNRRLGPRRGPVTVYLRGGEYPRRETFRLSEEDSGTAEAPIVYRSYPGESVRLYGGVRLTGFAPVTNGEILRRLPEAARGKVVQLDLRRAEVTDYRWAVPSVGSGDKPVMELFCNRRPLWVARWPNEGFVQVAKVIRQGSAAEKRGFTFQYEDDRPRRWPAKDLWLYGYFQHLWRDVVLGVASIDPESRQITTAAASPYEVREGHPYYAFNLLEELDVPGEWYLDRATGTLYVYPPADVKQAVFELSKLDAPLVELDNVSRVTLQQLTFELGQTDGLVIRGGDHCLVAGCTLRHLGGTGVVIQGGVNHGVLGCDLYTLGRGGTIVRGGDRKTLTPAGHFVENCHIYDFSRVWRTYTPAVRLEGVGNRIAHNLFHHSPGHAMRIEGNDHTIELNEIHHVVLETDDQGGLDMWFNPTYRGNVIRWNYWHHISSGRPCGQAGVRLDDAISGTLIYGNLFYRCAESRFGGVQIHGGKENVIDNNVFVDCRQAISFSPWGPARWKAFLESDRVIEATTKTVNIHQPPYSNRYPALARLAEDPDVNLIWRNLAFRCGEFLVRDQGIQDLRGNLITDLDPGVGEVGSRRFPWKPDPARMDAIGFRPIPLDAIGPYADPLRASWPIAERVP